MHTRGYDTYSTYLQHQASKLGKEPVAVLSANQAVKDQLAPRLALFPLPATVLSVLCLGARLGGEVEVFRTLGHFAVGIDINPGPRNRYVVFGDFHKLDFPKESVDLVYTNAMDHCLFLDTVLDEVARVLMPEGIFILEAVGQSKAIPGGYSSMFWGNLQEFLPPLSRHFVVKQTYAWGTSTIPWQTFMCMKI